MSNRNNFGNGQREELPNESLLFPRTDQNRGYTPQEPNPVPAPQVIEVYDEMRGFLKSTHWSKPYYSALVHNNPQLPYHLLEHVNCTYLSTPGRAPTLLALKQHAQSLAVLISLLAPAQFGGPLEPPFEGKTNGDAAFAAEQAFDWLNNLQAHYHTDDRAHKKPLNALINLVKSNSDTEGPKWHCPLEKTDIQLAEKHPFQQRRPYETHMTLLMHANEILERLDHEYSAMGGILGIIPLDNEDVSEQQALERAKTTLIGQWILHTQHLVVRMHELEIAYGNSLDLLANETVVPMQHRSAHGPDGWSGREIVFPQDRWILANAGEDVFTFIHQLLDRAEAHQDARDDVFTEQGLMGDAAFSSNADAKYRGIVKVDLSTRFYRLRGSGHGPLFVLPAFGDRDATKHTRDIEKRPTVVVIPQPSAKENLSSWESKHGNANTDVSRLTLEKENLSSEISQLNTSVELLDNEIKRLNEIQKQYDGKIANADKDFAAEVVRLNKNELELQNEIQEGQERERALEEEIEHFKKANLDIHSGSDGVVPLVKKIREQADEIKQLEDAIKETNKTVESLTRDNDTLRILRSSPFNGTGVAGNPEQLKQLQAQLASVQAERQWQQQENHTLRKAKAVTGKVLNFAAEGTKLDYGSTFEDTSLGITACSTEFYKSLLEADNERNRFQQKLDESVLKVHDVQAQLVAIRTENETLRKKEGQDQGEGVVNSGGGGSSSLKYTEEDLRATKEDLLLYKGQLASLQELGNGLQMQNAVLQSELEALRRGGVVGGGAQQ